MQQKSSGTTIFIVVSKGDQLLTQPGGPPIDLKTPNMDHLLTLQHIYIYMRAVELKAGPMFALFCVKNWSIFLFLKISLSLQKEEDFSNK